MTEYQAKEKAKYWIERSYRVANLAKRKDGRTYDQLYEVAKDISGIDYSLTRRLQDFATRMKKDYLNPNILDFAKELDFGNVEGEIIDVYGEAMTKFFMRELGVSSYDARQLWLACDREVLSRM